MPAADLIDGRAIASQIQAKAPSNTVHIGAPAMLGIGVGVNQQRTSGGVVVRDVLRGTPAEQAGLSRLLAEHVRFTCERVKSGAANPTLAAGVKCPNEAMKLEGKDWMRRL